MAGPLLAVTLPQFSERPGPALEAAADARRLGFAGAFVFDHLWPLGGPRTRPALECWTMLAAVAAATGGQGPEGSGEPQGGAPESQEHQGPGFRVGTLVTRAGLRAPAVVARMAATVGEVAGAPVVVGIGRGDLAGRVADAWNGWALTPEELAAGLAGARQAAELAGRDPAAVAGTWGGQVLVAPDRREAEARLARWAPGRPPAELARVVAGDPGTVVGRLRELGDAGAAWCVLATVGGPAAEMRELLVAAAAK
jgi:alkanesulfonate monooxygenase SsuD/methylene tetrahydromethanopterin reductase-like flavin-dependent oxidoreductase (luciferase family)